MTVLHGNDYFPSPDATLTVEPRTPQPPFPEHSHDFYEIFLVEKGTGVHIVNNVPYILRSGTVCFIRDRDRHLFENVNSLFLTNILYRSPQDFRFLSGMEYFLPCADEHSDLIHWQINQSVLLQAKVHIEALNRNIRNASLEAVATNEARFLQLITLLRCSGFQTEMRGSKDSCMNAMLDWLQHNYTEEIEWEQVAATFSLAPRTLHRQMKTRTGMTPQRYVNRLRLLEARRRLVQTRAPVTEIALDCGFGDSNHFSTLFRKEFSVSPKALRDSKRPQ